MNNTKIPELLLTRLSHDLVGNIGAISNGFELVSEETDLDFIKDTCTLLAQSSTVVARRIKFFRLAYGLVNKATSDRDEVKFATRDYLLTIGNKDFPIDFSLYVNDSMNETYFKIIMSLTMILADITIRGGNITVRNDSDMVELSLVTERLAPQDRLDIINDIITEKNDIIDAKYSPLYYARSLSQEINKKIDFVNSVSGVKFIIR